MLIALLVYGTQASTRQSRRTRMISTGGKLYRYSYQPTTTFPILAIYDSLLRFAYTAKKGLGNKTLRWNNVSQSK